MGQFAKFCPVFWDHFQNFALVMGTYSQTVALAMGANSEFLTVHICQTEELPLSDNFFTCFHCNFQQLGGPIYKAE